MLSDTVGVAPDDTLKQTHFGSAFATTNWVNQVHNVYVNASYMATEELQLTGTVVYNKTLGKLDPVDMPDVQDRTEGQLEHMDYDFSGIHEYSKVDFALWRFMVGGDYRVSSTWKATADFQYAHLDDAAPYVYGSETGSYWVARVGARMNF